MKRIKFGEVRIGEVARKHINECFDNNWVTLGPKVKLLEEKWAALNKCKYSVGTTSGTTALIAALMTLYDFGAKRGNKVIVPALGFIANSTAVLSAGFYPLFCDVRMDSMNMDENLVEDIIKKNPDCIAIMPITTMGKPYNVKAVREICDKYKLWLITDNCEGALCEVDGKYMEHYSDMCAVSMFSAHLVFAVEFGQVTTNREDLRNILTSIRSHGRKPNDLFFEHYRPSSNLKPTDLHACVGLESVDLFWDTFQIRKKNWSRMAADLQILEDKGFVYLSKEDAGEVVSPHGFSVILADPKYDIKKFQNHLDDCGIEWKRNFGACHTHKCYEFMNIPRGSYPVAEHAGDYGVHWGCHRWMTDDDVSYVIDCVIKYFTGK